MKFVYLLPVVISQQWIPLNGKQPMVTCNAYKGSPNYKTQIIEIKDDVSGRISNSYLYNNDGQGDRTCTKEAGIQNLIDMSQPGRIKFESTTHCVDENGSISYCPGDDQVFQLRTSYDIQVYKKYELSDIEFFDTELNPSSSDDVATDKTYCKLKSSERPLSIEISSDEVTVDQSEIIEINETGQMNSYEVQYTLKNTNDMENKEVEVVCSIKHQNPALEKIAKAATIRFKQLVDKDPPKITSFESQPANPAQQDKVSLVCSASGIPVPVVEIYDGETVIASSEDGKIPTAVYEIESAEIEKHHREYTCKAWNEISSDVGRQQVTINFVDMDQTSTTTATLGENLECFGYQYPKPLNVSWVNAETKLEGKYSYDEKIGRYSNIITPTSIGSYSCIVTSQDGISSEVMKIKVEDKNFLQLASNPIYWGSAAAVIILFVATIWLVIAKCGKSKKPEAAETLNSTLEEKDESVKIDVEGNAEQEPLTGSAQK